MTRLKHAVKVAVAHVLYYLGLLRLWQSIVLRRKAVVLMYHRVLTIEERRRTGSHPGIVVDRETFNRQMAVLKRRFTVLPLDEFARRMEQGTPFPDSACLITFDDGWEDNFINGLPILRQHGLPAVVFLPSNYIGQTRLFWREALTHLLVEMVRKARTHRDIGERCAPLLNAVGLAPVLAVQDEDPRAAIISAIAANHGLVARQVEQLLPALSLELGIEADELNTHDTFMDWRQVQQMSNEGIAFGGHGADHRLLTEIPIEDADTEIRLARQMIDERFTGIVPTFSYPNGNWNPQIVERVKESGYRVAFTTAPGRVSCNDNRFTVRRLNIHESATATTPMFLARILGLF